MKLNEMTKKSFEDDETTSMHQTELQQGRYENWNEQGNQQVPIFKRIKKNLKRGDKGKRYKRLRKHIDRKRPWAPHNTTQYIIMNKNYSKLMSESLDINFKSMIGISI